MIGINTAIFSQSGGNIGIGFAIPINLAKELVPQLEREGHVTRGWLGVSIQKLTPELAESLGVGETHGALVAGVTPRRPGREGGDQDGRRHHRLRRQAGGGARRVAEPGGRDAGRRDRSGQGAARRQTEDARA